MKNYIVEINDFIVSELSLDESDSKNVYAIRDMSSMLATHYLLLSYYRHGRSFYHMYKPSSSRSAMCTI